MLRSQAQHLHIRSSACSTTVEVVDADQQQEEGQWTFSGEMIVLLRALRGDGMTAETERALIADIVKPARQLGETGDGGGGKTKTPDGGTTAGQPFVSGFTTSR